MTGSILKLAEESMAFRNPASWHRNSQLSALTRRATTNANAPQAAGGISGDRHVSPHSYDFGVELLSRNTPTIAGMISNVGNLDIGRYDSDVDTWQLL